jgi:H+/Cl- antiporter ClcA
MKTESVTRRRARILARRHGPGSPLWRRRVATGVGAILVGLFALLFAEMANKAIEVFRHWVAAIWWLPLLVTPIGVTAIAVATHRFTPEGKGSGAGIIIVEATASRGMILPLFASALVADAAGRLVCKEKLYHALAREFAIPPRSESA